MANDDHRVGAGAALTRRSGRRLALATVVSAVALLVWTVIRGCSGPAPDPERVYGVLTPSPSDIAGDHTPVPDGKHISVGGKSSVAPVERTLTVRAMTSTGPLESFRVQWWKRDVIGTGSLLQWDDALPALPVTDGHVETSGGAASIPMRHSPRLLLVEAKSHVPQFAFVSPRETQVVVWLEAAHPQLVRLLDASTRVPVSGVVVIDSMTTRYARVASAATSTSGEATLLLPMSRRGVFRLRVHAPGYCPCERVFCTEYGELDSDPEPLTVLLQRGTSRTIRVLSRDSGLPIEGASVSVNARLSGRTNGDGEVTIQLPLCAWEQWCDVVAEGFALTKILLAATSGAEGAPAEPTRIVELGRGTIMSGIVEYPDRSPVPEGTEVVLEGDYSSADGRGQFREQLRATTASDGTFAMNAVWEGLGSSSCVVFAVTPLGETGYLVGTNSTKRPRIVVPRAESFRQYRVHVRRSDQEAIEGALASARWVVGSSTHASGASSSVLIGSIGTRVDRTVAFDTGIAEFLLPQLKGGHWVLDVEAPGCCMARADFPVGPESSEMSITLEPEVTLEGRVEGVVDSGPGVLDIECVALRRDMRTHGRLAMNGRFRLSLGREWIGETVRLQVRSGWWQGYEVIASCETTAPATDLTLRAK